MRVEVKPDVLPKSLHIFAAACAVALRLDLPFVIVTSGSDGRHMVGSEHYRDNALDFRRWGYTDQELARFTSALKVRLGGDYDVVIERTHVHVEYDSKRATKSDEVPA